MGHSQVIREYLLGPSTVRDAVEGLTPDQLRARPTPGSWSTLEVVCHLADLEALYAERMKRAIVADQPPFVPGEPEAWVSALACEHRNIEDELRLIDLIRRQVAGILYSLKPEDLRRPDAHGADRRLTLLDLLCLRM